MNKSWRVFTNVCLFHVKGKILYGFFVGHAIINENVDALFRAVTSLCFASKPFYYPDERWLKPIK